MSRMLCLAALMLPGVASAQANFRLQAASATCEFGSPMIKVKLANTGDLSAHTWLDVFLGRPTVPDPYEWGDVQVWVDSMPGGTTRTYFVDVAAAAGQDLVVDLLVDNDQLVAESDETDNVLSVWATFSSCP
jgi:hypothetical protein